MFVRPSGSQIGGLDDLHRETRAGRRDAGRATDDRERVTNWRTGDTIPLGRERTLRVVGIVVTNEHEPPVLIVEDVA
jgi:hypothetical protein